MKQLLELSRQLVDIASAKMSHVFILQITQIMPQIAVNQDRDEHLATQE